MSEPDLARYQQFLSTSIEDHESRSKIGLTDEEMERLHDLAVQGVVPWSLYHEVNNAKKADFMYLKDGKEKGYKISDIRERLKRVETKHYRDKDEEISETVYYRNWPVFQEIERTRRSNDAIVYELELAFPTDTDADTVFEKHRPGFEEESLLLAQRHKDIETVKEAAFIPSENVQYRVIISAGGQRKAFEFPVALRYGALLKKFARLNPLEDTKFEPQTMRRETLQRHSSYELGEGLFGLWIATLEYDPNKVKSIPGYIQQRVEWHLKGRYKALSTEAGKASRAPKQKRILKERLERSGGQLDAPLRKGSLTTLGDILANTNAPDPEAEAYYQGIMRQLPDPIDRKIVYGLTALDLTQKEMAEQLGMTQPAVSQRLKALQPKIRQILGR